MNRPDAHGGRGTSRVAQFMVAVLSALPVASCANLSQLAFTQDRRLTFISPVSRELVQLPLTLRWTMDDFRIVKPRSEAPAESAGYFAIFVDTPPIKPGQTLNDIAEDDTACSQDPKCPDRQYLTDRGIYQTTKTAFTLTLVPPLPTADDVQLHDVTVVLLDSAGHRIGESAWHTEFKLRKGSF